MENKTFNIRKRIAKHGTNSIIVIPKLLQERLPKGTIVDIRIQILEEAQSEIQSENAKKINEEINREGGN